jgi:Fe-S-cluster containining protein
MQFLQQTESEALDKMVHELQVAITTKIDCTQCGNCCKSLMIVVEEEEANHLSAVLQQTRDDFDHQYLEKSFSGRMIMNRIPCHFLTNNRCTVYEDRFAGCREFPALHIPQFRQRLFTTFMHYSRCPIIFNVLETLKRELSFVQSPIN